MIRPNKTGFKGVYAKGNLFAAIGWIDQKGHYLGYFATAEEASEVYLNWESNPSVAARRTRHLTDSQKEERSSPEMYEIVDRVFRKCIEDHATYLKAKEEYRNG